VKGDPCGYLYCDRATNGKHKTCRWHREDSKERIAVRRKRRLRRGECPECGGERALRADGTRFRYCEACREYNSAWSARIRELRRQFQLCVTCAAPAPMLEEPGRTGLMWKAQCDRCAGRRRR